MMENQLEKSLYRSGKSIVYEVHDNTVASKFAIVSREPHFKYRRAAISADSIMMHDASFISARPERLNLRNQF